MSVLVEKSYVLRKHTIKKDRYYTYNIASEMHIPNKKTILERRGHMYNYTTTVTFFAFCLAITVVAAEVLGVPALESCSHCGGGGAARVLEVVALDVVQYRSREGSG